ncbi:MAG: hypothetical protein LAQ69_15285 [Acidobacteriia bacterium]|nr:hypothetical protein [Terriglobia bacterium]
MLALSHAAFAQGVSVSLACGTAVDGTVGPMVTDFYNVSAQAGDSIWVRFLSTSGNRTFVPQVTVWDATNHLMTARPTPFTVTPNTIDPITVGAAFAGVFDFKNLGTYQIRVQNLGSEQGTYRLVYVWLNKPCLDSLLCGTAAVGQITSTLQTRSYSFQAKAGDLISARLARIGTADKNFDVAMFVFSSSGQLLNIVTGPNAATPAPLAAADTVTNGRAVLTVRATTDGPVTIVIFDPADLTGSYAISASRLNGPCGTSVLNCGSANQSKIGSPFSTESYSLDLVSGDPVFLRTAVVDAGSSLLPVLEIYDPQGNLVTLGSLSIFGPHKIINYALTASASGSYTILVRDGSPSLNGSGAFTNTGGYAISALRPNRPCKNAQGLACDPVDGSVSGLLGTTLYTANAKLNDRFIFRLLRGDQSSSFRPHVDIYDPQGNLFQTADAADLTRLGFTASLAGAYTLVVSDGFDSSQSGTFSLSLLPTNGACNTGTLSCGTVSTGSFSRPLASLVYTYTAAPGESFTVRMMDNTGALTPAVEVYDPRGNPIGQNISGNLTGVDVTNPAGGSHTVIATDAAKHPTGGPFGIDLLRTINACGVTTAQGQPASGVVSGAKPYSSYTIPVSGGDALSVRSASFTPGFSAQMDLYDPSGTRVDSATFGLSRKIAVTGNYTVIVGAAAARTGGSYSLAWQLLNHPVGTSTLACGGSATASLTASSEFRYYSASAGAGDLMRLILTRLSDNFAPQIELFDPTGTRLAQTSDISQKAGAGGSYLIVVSPSTSNGETGSYALAYQRPNNPCSPAALTCGQSTLRQANAPGQLDAFTFTGTGGDQADLKLTQRSGSYSPFAELYDSSGKLLVAGSGGQIKSILAAKGTYALLVRDRAGIGTGSYRVSLQDDTNACTVNDTEGPAVSLLAPTGGEVIAGGASYSIQWLSDDNVGVASHDVALSTDGGQTFPAAIASGLSGNAQGYIWNVPADIAPSRKAVIRVTATDGAGNANSVASGLISTIGSGYTPNSSATYGYDALNRLTQAVLGDGRTIQYAWDAAGNLVGITVAGQ